MKVQVLDKKGNKVEEITLKKEVFGIEPNLEVIKQYIRVYRANQRQGTSSTKSRGEVSGGGTKPWRQKGTGRARVGSSRNPLWRHGGVAHGPQPKDWTLTLPKKIKQMAMKSALSILAKENRMTVLDSIDMEMPKTKEILNILENLKLNGKTLIVINGSNPNAVKSARNIKGIKTTEAGTLNAYDILEARNVLFVKDAVKTVQEKY